ncbi:MAG: hypothetical protein KFF77_03300 [Bacteroidetes bacterium]|nr:hypothetical protein [Bacteroidota bacterium]
MSRSYRIFMVLIVLAACTTDTRAQGWSQALPTGTNQIINGIFSVSNQLAIAVGSNGTIIGTSDGGNTWSSGTSGTTKNLRKVFVSGLTIPTITVVGDDGTILRSTNVGVTWTPWTSGVTLDLHDIFVHDPTNGTTMTIVGESGVILWTNNGGQNWILRLSPLPKNLNGVFFKTLLEGFAVGDDGTILHTLNNGNNWLTVTSPSTTRLNHVFFPHADTGWIVGDGGAIIKTTDGGSSWVGQASVTSENLERVMFTDGSNGSIVGDNGVILRTSDGGANWQQQTSGTTFDLASVFFIDAQTGFACGERGLVIATTNGGWPVELSAFSATVRDGDAVQLHWETESETRNYGFEVERHAGDDWERLGFVAGHGDSRERHRYSFLDDGTAALADNSIGAPPILRYRLRQVDFDGGWEYSPEVHVSIARTPALVNLAGWPNPFREQTALQVTLPQAASVRLRVFDMSGRLVATLADGPLSAGTHALPWRSGGLGSGRYRAVLDVDGDPALRRSTGLVLQK